jgi:hypothetical protein
VHFFDTHEPYAGAGADPSTRYDAAVRSVDAAIGRLVGYARARLTRPMIVAVTADHGEEFGEHGGVYHGSTLYEEQVRVPLLIAGPGIGPSLVETPVELVDLAPSLLGLVGLARPASMRGRDLRTLMWRRGLERLDQWPAFSAVGTKTMAVRWPYKVIVDRGYRTTELYDLSQDRAERANLAETHAGRLAQLRNELGAWQEALGLSAAGSLAVARGRMGDREALRLLADIARDRRGANRERLEAIDVLGESDEAWAVAPLASLLGDSSSELADRAAWALGQTGSPAARSRLTEALTREEPADRARAAVALARLGDQRAVPTLVDLLSSPDEAVRIAAVDSLGGLRARSAAWALLQAAEQDHLRYRAALALGRLGEPGTFSALRQMAEHDRQDDVRANAAAALGIAGDHAAIGLLTRLARDDPTQRYATAALGRLGAIGSLVAGWDARSATGDGFGACGPIRDDPALDALGARACRSDGVARVPIRAPDSARPALLLVGARGAGPLEIGVHSSVFARLPLGQSWRELRVPLPARALSPKDAVLDFRSPGPFWLAYAVVLLELRGEPYRGSGIARPQ